MNKALLIIGKILIICGPLFPVPLGFILYPWFGYKIGMPMWGEEWGYWTPMFYVMGLGLLLCRISGYKAKDVSKYENIPFRETITSLLIRIIGWGLGVVAVFMLLTLLVIVFWFLFLTERVLISVPVLFGMALVGFLLWFGYTYYKRYNDRT